MARRLYKLIGKVLDGKLCNNFTTAQCDKWVGWLEIILSLVGVQMKFWVKKTMPIFL